MRTGFLCHSILQVPRCRIQSLPYLQSTYVASLSETCFKLRHSCGNGFGFKLLRLNEPSQGAVYRTRILRPTSTSTWQRTKDAKSSKPGNLRHELDGTVEASTVNNSDLRCFQSIQYCDAQRKILESQDSTRLVRVFVFDIETTGFCREKGRIIEIAIRDLSGGENSCFQTLVNPEQDVLNSFIHGITTKMVNNPDVPRMKDLIPILLQYIESRLRPGELALFVAHNARCFDVPFLKKEFSRCSMDIPSDWLVLDTLPLARELMKLNGSKLSKFSLQALSEHFEVPLQGSPHRAMSDVNILSSILERITFDMKLTVSDLLERYSNSFKDADLVNLKKKNKNKKS